MTGDIDIGRAAIGVSPSPLVFLFPGDGSALPLPLPLPLLLSTAEEPSISNKAPPPPPRPGNWRLFLDSFVGDSDLPTLLLIFKLAMGVRSCEGAPREESIVRFPLPFRRNGLGIMSASLIAREVSKVAGWNAPPRESGASEENPSVGNWDGAA